MNVRKDRKRGRKPAADPVHEGEKISLPADEFEGMVERCREWAEYKDRYLRTLADLENLRKRFEKEKRDYIDYATQDLIYELVQVLDNFDRALSAAGSSDDTYRQGIEMISRQFREVLRKQGLEEIRAVGERFDPFVHEAVEQVESESVPEDTVVEEILKGYTLKGRLLRPSAVKVARPPAAEETVDGGIPGDQPRDA